MAIDNRLYHDLFQEKTVSCNQNLYRELYPVIWPCEKLFMQFLNSSNSSVKIDCAKKIFRYFNSCNDIIFPDFIISELISIQQHNLKNSTNYIPQDHFIHSINLYVLGIYVFFNVEVFHRKLIEDSAEQNHIEKLKSFIFKWKLFALYHDVGYVLEGYVDENGIIKNTDSVNRYQTIYSDLFDKYIIQIITKLITCIYILNQSSQKFSVDFNYLSDCQWENDFNIVDTPNLKKKLMNYSDYIQLEGIQTYQDYKYVYWLLRDQDYMVMYVNEHGHPVIFKFVNQHNKSDVIYSRNLSKSFIQDILQSENLNLTTYNVTCKYFVQNLNHKILNLIPIRYHDEIFNYYNLIPKDIQSKVSLISNPNCIEQIYMIIYSWMCQAITNYKISENSSKLLVKEKVITETFQDLLNDNIRRIIKSNISLDNILGEIQKLFGQISINELERKIRINSNMKLGIPSPIMHYYRYLSNDIGKRIDFSNRNLIFEEKSIRIHPFSYDEKDTFANSIYLKLQERANQLNIDFEKLKNYSTNYTKCDHGLISSILMFDVITFNERLVKLLPQKSILYLAFNSQDIIENIATQEVIEKYANIIFSILLHNIYTNNTKKYGIEYKQNVDLNPFSYFGALMDSLQKWGRPKQLDQSIVDLPSNHFLENDFDIVCSDNIIQISCSSSSAGNMRKEINTLEEYLPGASSIIKLYEKEL